MQAVVIRKIHIILYDGEITADVAFLQERNAASVL